MPSFRSAFVFTALALAAFSSAAPTVAGANDVVNTAKNLAGFAARANHNKANNDVMVARGDCTSCGTVAGATVWAHAEIDALIQAQAVLVKIDAAVAAKAIVDVKKVVVNTIAHIDALVDVNVDVKVSVVVDLLVKIVAQINAIVAACIKANVTIDVAAVVALVAQLLAKVTVHVSATVKAEICAQVVAAVKAIVGLDINVDALVNVATSAAHVAAPTL